MIQTGTISVIFCSLILMYASYSDIKTRSVANELWLLMIAAGVPLVIYNSVLYGIPFLSRFSYSLLFTLMLSYLFFRFYLFGGADAKSLIGIAVLIPTNPRYTFLLPDPFPFAITTLFNATVISLMVPAFLLLYNVLNLRDKGLREHLGLAFIGYKIRIETLGMGTHKHLRSLHAYEGEGEGEEGALKRKLILGGVEIDKDLIEKLKDYHERGKIGEEVWVTPEIPFMLYITFGFFISLFYGNLILRILFSIFLP